jgi:phage baseplate assembly protein W
VATIDLNNLVRPKQTNYSKTKISDIVEVNVPVYVDLHLDLKLNKSVGLGNSTVNSNDILVDYDIQAIKNSIKNIFTTRKGQKILTPNFGSSLEQYLFEPVNEVYGRAIGQEILDSISSFEPRVEVTKVKVEPFPDDNTYRISVAYNFLEIKKQSILTIFAKQGGEILI